MSFTDKEIIEIVDNALERYCKTTTEFFEIEIDGVRKEVQGVRKEFERMNGSLRDVCRWKNEQEGIDKFKTKNIGHKLQIAGVVIAFLMFGAAMFFGWKNLNRQNHEIRNEVRDIMPPAVRGIYNYNDSVNKR